MLLSSYMLSTLAMSWHSWSDQEVTITNVNTQQARVKSKFWRKTLLLQAYVNGMLISNIWVQLFPIIILPGLCHLECYIFLCIGHRCHKMVQFWCPAEFPYTLWSSEVRTGVFKSVNIILGWIIHFLSSGCLVHCSMLRVSVQNSRKSLPSVPMELITIKNVSRHSQISLGKQNFCCTESPF
jgi:hypothetical protein